LHPNNSRAILLKGYFLRLNFNFQNSSRLFLQTPRSVRLAYPPPASSTFLSDQTSHQQPVSSTFLSENKPAPALSHPSNEHAEGCTGLEHNAWLSDSLYFAWLLHHQKSNDQEHNGGGDPPTCLAAAAQAQCMDYVCCIVLHPPPCLLASYLSFENCVHEELAMRFDPSSVKKERWKDRVAWAGVAAGTGSGLPAPIRCILGCFFFSAF
jgi:hypothetical protein